MFYKAFASISRTVLGCFSEKVLGEWKCKGKADLEESYKEFIAGGEDDFVIQPINSEGLKEMWF